MCFYWRRTESLFKLKRASRGPGREKKSKTSQTLQFKSAKLKSSFQMAGFYIWKGGGGNEAAARVSKFQPAAQPMSILKLRKLLKACQDFLFKKGSIQCKVVAGFFFKIYKYL